MTSRQLTLWSEDSPASPSASRAAGEVTPTNAGSGRSSTGWCANCDPDGFALKMFLGSALSALTGSFKIWSRADTPSGRSWWVLTTLERRTGESESSSWPTATIQDSIGSGSRGYGKVSRSTGRPRSEGVTLTDAIVRFPIWPTPTSQDAENNAGPSQFERNSYPLNVAVTLGPPAPESRSTSGSRPGWSTPRGQDEYERRNWKTIVKVNEEGGDLTLPSQVKYGEKNNWPTAAADTGKGGAHGIGEGSAANLKLKRLGMREMGTGALNPDWVSCLMGFPVTWLHGTAAPGSRPSATPSFPPAPK